MHCAGSGQLLVGPRHRRAHEVVDLDHPGAVLPLPQRAFIPSREREPFELQDLLRTHVQQHDVGRRLRLTSLPGRPPLPTAARDAVRRAAARGRSAALPDSVDVKIGHHPPAVGMQAGQQGVDDRLRPAARHRPAVGMARRGEEHAECPGDRAVQRQCGVCGQPGEERTGALFTEQPVHQGSWPRARTAELHVGEQPVRDGVGRSGPAQKSAGRAEGTRGRGHRRPIDLRPGSAGSSHQPRPSPTVDAELLDLLAQ